MLAPADSAPLLLPEPGELTLTPLHEAVLTALDGGGGLFFRMLADRVAALLLDGQAPARPPTPRSPRPSGTWSGRGC